MIFKFCLFLLHFNDKNKCFLQKVGILFKIALNQDWRSIQLLCFINTVSNNNKQPLLSKHIELRNDVQKIIGFSKEKKIT